MAVININREMISRYFIVVSVLLFTCTPLCRGQSAKSDSLYSIGVELFNEGQYDKAITYFKDSHVLDCAEMDSLSPRRNYSAEWLAYCYYKTGNIDEAKKYNKICYKSKPIDRRLTVRIDSLSAESTKDFMNKHFYSALEKADEVDRLESSICEENSFFHVGTYQMKANCYGALQKLDSALYYMQKVRKIENIYFEKFDTLSVGTLNGLFYLNLNLHQYDAAKSYNEELTKIMEYNFDSKHFLNAETNFQRVILHLYQREWGKAHEALPEYLNILKYCFGNNPEVYKRTVLTIRNNFEMCGRFDDVKFIDNNNVEMTKSNEAIGPKERIEAMVLQYVNNLQSKDSLNYDRIEKEMVQLLDSYPEDSLKEQRSLIPCLQTMRLFAGGNLYEAQNVFLKFQKDSLERYLDEQSEYYPAYLVTKGAVCVSLDDFEGGISAYTKFLGRMNIYQQRQNPNILAQVACLHAMAGHYKKAREMTDKAIRDYKQYIVDTGASFRLDVDTMRVGQIVNQIQTYISNSGALPDSAVYMLREIRSDYLLLKADLLKNTKRYQLDNDYYECVSNYAFELVRMRKFVEAQEVMDNYLADWYKCYNSIDENSKIENDIWDRLLGRMTLEDALEFRKRKCYEKGDPAGVKAHKDYIEYIKEEYEEKSGEFFNAMVNYFDYIDDYTSLLSYLSAAIDERPGDYLPYAYKLTADTYERVNQPELSLKYRKGYITACLRDSTARKDNESEILSAVNKIVEYYVEVKKDTIALYHYYQDELWPSLDVCEDDYMKYYLRTIDKLCFDIDDDSFIPFVEKEVERKNQFYSSPIIQGCVDQVIAGVLSRGKNKKGRAIDYMQQACKEVETDSVLHLLFSCRLHDVIERCAPDSSVLTIHVGDKLIKQMGLKEEWKYTHEYAELVERQLKLLQQEQRYDEIVSLCHSYLHDFTLKKSSDLDYLLNGNHPMYESFDFLNHVTLNSWSSDVTIPTANEALYTALSINKPQEAGEYALNLVHDSYDDIESSLDINYISTWKCDKLISQTSKLAYKHQTDSLKMYAYDASLLCKGLKLRSDYAIRAIIQQSGHKSALRKYDELQYTLRLIEKAAEDKVDSLQDRVKTLERDLFRLSEFFGDYKKSLYNSWRDVQKALKDDDIAIEFTIVEKDYDDKYVRRDTTFSEGYYACILRKGMPMPEIVFICETDSIDTSPSIYYHTDVTRKLLEPLGQYMNGVRNIFFSPIGQLNQMSIESLPQLNDSTKTLSQMYNIYRLSSTRELIPNNYRIVGTNAVVYGGLTYNASVDVMQTDSKNYIEKQTRDLTIEDSLDIWGVRSVISDIPYLAGTKIEADNVTLTINSAKDTLLVAQEYEGVKGTEASFKSLSGERKRIIHLATHGFYFNRHETEKLQSIIGKDLKKRKEEDQSLMRSGLFLTGAENKYQGEVIPEGIEDGILTAQEIANTDLTGLDLCVLSACQTAQGDISSEGVFGLQRGFKKAGAQSILMSLWRVDDEATCMLMTEFYKNWISENMSKHYALEEAKQTVRSHKEKGWDDPKYWAAFVLLDGLD
jgi:CHAT domain-containing protein